jgi:large subunit ribosomal protein L25
MTFELTVTPRAKVGTRASKKIRSNGNIPGIVYGAGEDAQTIEISSKDFDKVWKSAGESTIVTLKGLGKDRSVLIQDVELDKIFSNPIHVDLLAVKADEVVEVGVPLVFAGVSPAEKDLGGSLVKVMYEIEIEALPKDLPHEITVDISNLKTFDDQVKVSDIVLPTGVKAVTAANEVVALVQPPRAEEEEKPAEPVDLSTIEVEKKGKVEEEGAVEEK